jgi:peptide/nickel transport system substrate-binding protein
MATQSPETSHLDVASFVDDATFSRRALLKRAAALGLGGAVFAGLLAACADDDDDDTPPAVDPADDDTEDPDTTDEDEDDEVEEDDEDEGDAPDDAPATAGGTLTYVMPAEPATLDPHVSSSRYDGQVLAQICNTLMYWTYDLELTAGLATAWSVDDEGLTYTLELRDDVTFHDGTDFNAEAIVINLDRIMDPATASEGARFALGPYESSRAVDEYTLEVTTSAPFGPMMNALGGMYTISPAAIEEYGPTNSLFNNPVGTGPFVFEEWVPTGHIRLSKNEDFNWAPDVWNHQGPPHVDELVIRFIEEGGTRLATLEAGEADIILETPPDQVENLMNSGDFVVERTLVSGIPHHLAFNNQRSPVDEVEFRQALQYILDTEMLNEAVNYGVWEIETGPITSNTAMYEPQAAKSAMYPYDPEQGEALLDELGWVMENGMRMKDGEPLELVYLTLPNYAPIAEAVQAILSGHGIGITIVAEGNPAQQNSAQQGEHHIVWMQWSGIDPALMRTVFHSENAGIGWNFSHYANPEVDELLEAQAVETDEAARAEIFSQIQLTIMEDAAILPLWPQNRIWGINADVQGFAVHPGGEVLWPYDISFRG